MRTLFLIISLIASLTVFAQQKVHVVSRGETLASIASKYGCTVEAIQKVNPFLRKLYAGTEIKIPVVETKVSNTTSENKIGVQMQSVTPTYADSNKSQTVSLTSLSSESDSSGIEKISRLAQAYIDSGESYMKDGKHQKAIKEFNKSIEIQESLNAHWLRGRCYFYIEKWKKAAEDLAIVMNSSQTTNSIRQDAEQMYSYAAQQQEIKRQKRSEFWLKAAAGAVMVAAVAGTAALSKEQAKSSGGTSSGGNSSSSDYDTDSESSSGGWANSQSGYQSIYDTKANAAESLFKTLTDGNTRHQNNGIQTGAKRNQSNALNSGSYNSLKPKLDKIQRELVSIRQEAESKGFRINPSKWETATVY